MYIKREDGHIRNIYMAKKLKETSHSGVGKLDAVRLFEKGSFNSAIHFIDYVIMPPGATIGLHQHADNEEIYFILKGKGTMLLDDQSYQVSPGDVIVNRVGGTHGLNNDSQEDIEIFIFEVGLGTDGLVNT